MTRSSHFNGNGLGIPEPRACHGTSMAAVLIPDLIIDLAPAENTGRDPGSRHVRPNLPLSGDARGPPAPGIVLGLQRGRREQPNCPSRALTSDEVRRRGSLTAR